MPRMRMLGNKEASKRQLSVMNQNFHTFFMFETMIVRNVPICQSKENPDQKNITPAGQNQMI